MTGAELEAILYPTAARDASLRRPMPNWAEVRQELARHRSLTLHQLWKEYIAAHPTGYQYSRICELYRRWRSTQVDPVIRLTHKAGERLFVDYSGKKPRIADPVTGEVREVESFVAALDASAYLYAEATETQKVADFCGSIRRAFEFFDGVPRLIVPDNLKSAIIKFRTDDTPILNESFRDLAEHYNVGVLPARPRKPRDKAKAESSVAILQRSVMGALRNVVFHILAELNPLIIVAVDVGKRFVILAPLAHRYRLPGALAQPTAFIALAVYLIIPSVEQVVFPVFVGAEAGFRFTGKLRPVGLGLGFGTFLICEYTTHYKVVLRCAAGETVCRRSGGSRKRAFRV